LSDAGDTALFDAVGTTLGFNLAQWLGARASSTNRPNSWNLEPKSDVKTDARLATLDRT